MFPVIQWKYSNVLAFAPAKFRIQKRATIPREEPSVHRIIAGQQGFLRPAIDRFPEHAVFAVFIATVSDALSVGCPRWIPVFDARSETRLGIASDVVHPSIGHRPFNGGGDEAAVR